MSALGMVQPPQNYMLSPAASANKSKDLMVTFLFLITVGGVATCIGLTFKPTSALKKGQELTTDADGTIPPGAHICKSCALDPVKLYSWSFGWSIGGGLILLVVGWVYVNWKLKKHSWAMGNAYAALGGTDTLTGAQAQGMYARDQAMGNVYGQINQTNAQGDIGAYHAASQKQMLKQQAAMGAGLGGGGWVSASRP